MHLVQNNHRKHSINNDNIQHKNDTITHGTKICILGKNFINILKLPNVTAFHNLIILKKKNHTAL